MAWTRLDRVLVVIPIVLFLMVLGWRAYVLLQLNDAADQVAENIRSVAKAAENYQAGTGRWFPLDAEEVGGARRVMIYMDVFDESNPSYQGLNDAWLRRENNSGLVLQLVKYELETSDLPGHLFAVPYVDGEPYLRVLLDYGSRFLAESEIMLRVQALLPAGAIAEVDDHYYVVDLRRLVNVDP